MLAYSQLPQPATACNWCMKVRLGGHPNSGISSITKHCCWYHIQPH